MTGGWRHIRRPWNAISGPNQRVSRNNCTRLDIVPTSAAISVPGSRATVRREGVTFRLSLRRSGVGRRDIIRESAGVVRVCQQLFLKVRHTCTPRPPQWIYDRTSFFLHNCGTRVAWSHPSYSCPTQAPTPTMPHVYIIVHTKGWKVFLRPKEKQKTRQAPNKVSVRSFGRSE